MATPTHITTSDGLISAAFIENVRAPGSRQRGVKPVSFALPWIKAPKNPAALEETIATAWELLLERWDAVRNESEERDEPTCTCWKRIKPPLSASSNPNSDDSISRRWRHCAPKCRTLTASERLCGRNLAVWKPAVAPPRSTSQH